jgi:ppGpp synthetase/RelA/SpoT-type nucleotidyltranferase
VPTGPSVPSPSGASDPAPAAVEAYAAGHDDLVLAGAEAVELVTGLLDEAGINYLTVSGRTKSVASFAEKAVRSADGKRIYSDPLREIGDQLGVRVITYVRDDVAAVAEVLADQVVVNDDRDLGRETASEGRFGYASRHLQIALDAARVGQPAYAHLAGRNVQIQIRTVLQHAWAEFEHDIRYKGTVPAEHAHDFDRRFTLAAGLLELADQEFATIRDRLRGQVSSAGHAEPVTLDDDPRLDARELAAFLAGQYADAGWSRADHYDWVSGLLLELGITSLDELGDVLRATDEQLIRDRMDYRYPPGAVRRLDDALLATYGSTYVALHGNAHREAALRARLDKLRDTTDATP